MMRIGIIATLLAPLLAGCAPTAPSGPEAQEARIGALTRTITALGPEVDPGEAARAALVSVETALRLRGEYGVTDPPLIHNTKVNMGLRPRGLCYQWADDIEAELRREGFRTLELHRAIANADTVLIDHSTVIVSRRGDAMPQGVVLDGWRDGGELFFAPVLEDVRYRWVPRMDVMAEREAQEQGR